MSEEIEVRCDLCGHWFKVEEEEEIPEAVDYICQGCWEDMDCGDGYEGI